MLGNFALTLAFLTVHLKQYQQLLSAAEYHQQRQLRQTFTGFRNCAPQNRSYCGYFKRQKMRFHKEDRGNCFQSITGCEQHRLQEAQHLATLQPGLHQEHKHAQVHNQQGKDIEWQRNPRLDGQQFRFLQEQWQSFLGGLQ